MLPDVRHERVADVGAGTGYFTFPVAMAAGPTGQVLALDTAPEMLEYPAMRVEARKAAAGFRVLAAHDFLPEQFFVVYGVR